MTRCPYFSSGERSGETVTTLGKPAGAGEKWTVSEWNKLRRRARTVIAEQSRRLSEAMITQRCWSAT